VGEGSQEFYDLLVNPDIVDLGLHEIGVKQAEEYAPKIHHVNFKVVFVSPYQRTLQTAIHMFKNHPKKS
jgi:broad specificity phosphatase PhoE